MLDVFISVLCSLFTYLLVLYVLNTQPLIGYILWVSIYSTISSTIAFYITKTYKHTIRHSTLENIWNIIIAVIIKDSILFLLLYLTQLKEIELPIILFGVIIDAILTSIALTFVRMIIISFYNMIGSDSKESLKTLIYGYDNSSVSLQKSLIENKSYNVLGFYAYGTTYHNYRIANLPVYYFFNEQDFKNFTEKKRIDAILFPNYTSVQTEKDRLISFCKKCKVKLLIFPPVNELNTSEAIKNPIRHISIEDLLGREEISINMSEINTQFLYKTILVTGAAGSIGSELCRQLANLDIKQLVLYDMAETPMHNLQLELKEKYPNLDFIPIIGDIRDTERLRLFFSRYKPDIVFHAAAYKHVPLMEDNPREAIKVNTLGTKTIADLSVEHGVKKMIMISTDKAVNPTSIMGASKRMAEIYVQSKGIAISNGTIEGKTQFITTRFGNVLGSNGSVIPLFREQIKNGGPVTVTHPDIIRYFMTIPEACGLVMEAAILSGGNEIFVFDMGEPVKIKDLAIKMIELAGYIPDEDIKIVFTGLRLGEKLYEELLNNEESTIVTSHSKIRIAKVREYEYSRVIKDFDSIKELSTLNTEEHLIRKIMEMIPEFTPNNQKFLTLKND